MIYFIIIMIIAWIWIAWEFFRAPCLDDNGNKINKKK